VEKDFDVWGSMAENLLINVLLHSTVYEINVEIRSRDCEDIVGVGFTLESTAKKVPEVRKGDFQ
jgi:hypothetical protein